MGLLVSQQHTQASTRPPTDGMPSLHCTTLLSAFIVCMSAAAAVRQANHSPLPLPCLISLWLGSDPPFYSLCLSLSLPFDCTPPSVSPLVKPSMIHHSSTAEKERPASLPYPFTHQQTQQAPLTHHTGQASAIH
mmetsp:Transcript_35034/g.86995  ORF Transcript_35034/g.86995 Transcript_35034/m.86995 type:complete len:134 (-) Transcript_35034:1157-1558(-)